MTRIKVAVFFGGVSFEHDVSILTGLQVCQALPIAKYEALPVYADKTGRMWTGAALLDAKAYPVKDFGGLRRVEVVAGPALRAEGFFRPGLLPFDVAFPAFHGGAGESGGIQGLFEILGIPCAGPDVASAAISMSKLATKRFCRDLGIKVLPENALRKPAGGEFFDIGKVVGGVSLPLPVIVKPEALGSSVAVAKAQSRDELAAGVLEVFKVDRIALVEPFVPHLVEYNVAVMRGAEGRTLTSVIEMPKNDGKLLSFADKYLSRGGAKKKGAAPLSAMPSDETVRSRRDFAPHLAPAQEEFIRASAASLYEALGMTAAAPRIDYLCDGETGELWLNEINPIPGAMAFYLWENSEHRISYPSLIDTLITSALADAKAKAVSIDLSRFGSAIFK
ncbi:D-alanine--D-alanine ligase [Alphaproteobacteria bacterium]|nr:D-alanine--D-alanine ligase [Alphaproteobacteria bacterium]